VALASFRQRRDERLDVNASVPECETSSSLTGTTVREWSATEIKERRSIAKEVSRLKRNHSLNNKVAVSPSFLKVPVLAYSYLAGFFDADGCVGVYESPSRGVYLSAEVTGNHRDSIERFRRVFGGPAVRKVVRDRPNRPLSVIWQWLVTGRTAAYALSLITPYLNVKQPQAVAASRLHISPVGTHVRRWSVREIKERRAIAKEVRSLKQCIT
jgi:hypothetical protein